VVCCVVFGCAPWRDTAPRRLQINSVPAKKREASPRENGYLVLLDD
jgi:hypothetical protein